MSDNSNSHDHDQDHSFGPTTEEIARCAYLIWEREGKQPGRDREYWVQAETQLRACRAHDHWTSGEKQGQQN